MRLLLLAIPLLFAACQTPTVSSDLESAVVFFREDSAALELGANAVLNKSVELAKNRPSTIVYVLGFAPSDAGSVGYNQSLSRTRALAVVDALVKAGVDRTRIRLKAQGGVPYEMGPIESRRVEIIIGT